MAFESDGAFVAIRNRHLRACSYVAGIHDQLGMGINGRSHVFSCHCASYSRAIRFAQDASATWRVLSYTAQLSWGGGKRWHKLYGIAQDQNQPDHIDIR